MVVIEDLGRSCAFSAIIQHHLSVLDYEDKDVEEMFEKFSGLEEVIPFVSSLKEEGNQLFILNDFSGAFVKYEKAIKLLCAVITVVCEDFSLCDDEPPFKDLVIPLHLNLAACGLKLNKFKNVIEVCSLVLGVDKKNVKALFRGLAFKKMGYLEKAFEDLLKAKELEPKNKDISTEFPNLEKALFPLIQVEGDDDPSNDLGCGKLEIRTQGKFEAQESKPGLQEKQVKYDSKGKDKGNEFGDSSIPISKPSVGPAHREMDVRVDYMMVDNEERAASSHEGKVVFTNKRKPFMRLCVSRADVCKIRKGSEVQMFQPHSLSVLKVRPYISNPPSSTILARASTNPDSKSAEVVDSFPNEEESSSEGIHIMVNAQSHHRIEETSNVMKDVPVTSLEDDKISEGKSNVIRNKNEVQIQDELRKNHERSPNTMKRRCSVADRSSSLFKVQEKRQNGLIATAEESARTRARRRHSKIGQVVCYVGSKRNCGSPPPSDSSYHVKKKHAWYTNLGSCNNVLDCQNNGCVDI